MMGNEALNDIASREIIAFQRRQSLNFIDCAVNLACVDYQDNLSFVIQHLRDLAQHLEDHS